MTTNAQETWPACVEGDRGMYTPVRLNTASGDTECLASEANDDDCMWAALDVCEERRQTPSSEKSIACAGGSYGSNRFKRRRATKAEENSRNWCAAALTRLHNVPVFRCQMDLSSQEEVFLVTSLSDKEEDVECIWDDSQGACASFASVDDCTSWLTSLEDLSTLRRHGAPVEVRSTLVNDTLHPLHRRLDLRTSLFDAPTTEAPERVAAVLPTPTPPAIGNNDTLVLVISISVAVAVLAAWIGFLLYRRRQQTFYECHDDAERVSKLSYAHMMETTPAPPLNLSYLEVYRINAQDLTVTSMLGSGGFADVYLGSFRGHQVAIKTLLQNHPTRRELAAFADEIQILAMLHSPFIVEFVGASWTDGAVQGLQCVMEYMDRGDLKEVLSMLGPEVFPWSEKLHCIQSIAEGLVYLHSFPIIHRDLKSRNVLLDSSKGTKLTDFGGSREETTSTMTAGVGTYRWMAPEVLLSHRYTTAADVYSFGMLLTEFDTHDIPFVNLKDPSTGKALSDVTIVGMLISGSVDIPFSPAMPPWLASLGRRCVSRDPAHRPTSMDIANLLREHIQV